MILIPLVLASINLSENFESVSLLEANLLAKYLRLNYSRQGAAGFSPAMKVNELNAKVLMVNNDSIRLGYMSNTKNRSNNINSFFYIILDHIKSIVRILNYFFYSHNS